jgi:hypothetical protein
MSSVHWLKTNNVYRKVEGDFKTVDTVPAGIYNLGVSMTGWYLEKYADKFTFDYKMYGLQTEFCNHVLKTYQNTSGNFGIMLTGTKGTGKTVTAKTLANDFNLPVIIVKDMGDSNQSMIEYLSGFNFDCVLFLDEFEKNFSDKDSTILQIMDGVYNIGYRKIFLLTTNELTVNENLLGRPSRIRYVKRFGNLELKTIEEYLDDELKVPEARQELIDFIDTLTISTIDILKTIVNEVNIHGIDGLMKAKEFFNVTTLEFNYSCVRGYVEEDEMIADPDKYNMKNFLRDVNKYENPIWEPAFYRNTPREQWTDSQKKEFDEWQENRKRIFNSVQRTTCHTNCRFNHLKVGGEFDNEEIVILDIKKGVVVTRYDDYFYWYYVSNPNKKPSLYGDSMADFARYLDY